DAAAPDSLVERTLFDRLAGGLRIEPILGRLRSAPATASAPAQLSPAEGSALPPPGSEFEALAGTAVTDEYDDNPFAPDTLLGEQPAAADTLALGVKIVPRKSAAAQGRRAARAGQRELDLGVGEYRLPPLDLLSLPS